MTGGDPEALSVPFGFICIIHLQASTINIYQLRPFRINGAISWMSLSHAACSQPILLPSLFLRRCSCPPSLAGQREPLACCPIFLASHTYFNVPSTFIGCSLQWTPFFFPFGASFSWKLNMMMMSCVIHCKHLTRGTRGPNPAFPLKQPCSLLQPVLC